MRDKDQTMLERSHGPVETQHPKGEASATVHYTELPDGDPASPLFREWSCYRREAKRLLAEGHEGRFVLAKDDRVIAVFDTSCTFREKLSVGSGMDEAV